MPECFEPRIDILPKPQQEIWPLLGPAARFSFVLYGGTAVALYLGHRVSVDFDFFSAAPLAKRELEASLAFLRDARAIQESENTLVVLAAMPSGPVKVSLFGGISFGRAKEPKQASGSSLLVASLTDLMATKLKAILDRAEAKDYRDIAAMLSAGVSLQDGLGAFTKMYGKDAALPLRAIGFFEDGDLSSVPQSDRKILCAARDRVTEIPDLPMTYGSLAVPVGDCGP